ncbi:MAG: zinc-ribbon domain-containing protein [Oscillospiraceae bacterium]|nr:zinc-ribbon domain-containing protein [Oscillospiraceae bacterium]
MKYCSKCGNELFDEAVICPKCGCPVGSGTANQETGGKNRGKVLEYFYLFFLAYLAPFLH